MNILDKALLDFVRRNDGKQPMVIYLGWDVLVDVMESDKRFQLDTRNHLYYGIPFYRVVHDDKHLAVY